jgi:hypothetical protein
VGVVFRVQRRSEDAPAAAAGRWPRWREGSEGAAPPGLRTVGRGRRRRGAPWGRGAHWLWGRAAAGVMAVGATAGWTHRALRGVDRAARAFTALLALAPAGALGVEQASFEDVDAVLDREIRTLLRRAETVGLLPTCEVHRLQDFADELRLVQGAAAAGERRVAAVAAERPDLAGSWRASTVARHRREPPGSSGGSPSVASSERMARAGLLFGGLLEPSAGTGARPQPAVGGLDGDRRRRIPLGSTAGLDADARQGKPSLPSTRRDDAQGAR